MQSALLTEIPSSLKQLARLVVRGFYDIEYSLIIDMLVRYPCMREDDLCDLLKFDKKILRSKLATLKADKFLQVKLRIETGEDGKANKVQCFFINYKVFVNIVKYKLDHMRKKMEIEERDATSRSSFRCLQCEKQFTDLEADQLIDFTTGEFKCTYCGGIVEEDESAMPKKDSRLLLAKFNEQMEKLYELLRIVEDIRLAPEVLEPDPVDILNRNNLGELAKMRGPASGDPNDGKWSGEQSRAGGFRTEEQQAIITFGEGENKEGREKKEAPQWMTESTVEVGESAGGMGEDSLVAQQLGEEAVGGVGSGQGAEQEDEITNLLLRHERQQKGGPGVAQAQGGGWGADDTDSDNRSDESDVEDAGDKDTVDRDAALLAATFAGNDGGDEGMDDVVEEMDDDSGEDDDIPTIKVGGEEYDITDVTTEIIAKMTTEEMEKYNQLYQDFYRDMYD